MDAHALMTEADKLRDDNQFFVTEREWTYKRIIELECLFSSQYEDSPDAAAQGER